MYSGGAERNTPTSVGKTRHAGVEPAHPQETPPRAWGRPQDDVLQLRAWRNTPTSVGKTHPQNGRDASNEKHPHERGEDSWTPRSERSLIETPPRAWGRLTSPRLAKPLVRKHPHERGEDLVWLSAVPMKAETPPRAWGRHWILLVLTGGWWRFVLWLYLFFNHKGHA